MAEAVRHDKTSRQLRLLSDALDSGRLGPVRRLVNTLAPAEIGNLLESLPPGKREVVWGLVDAEDDGEVLVHVGDEVRESLLAAMDTDEIIAAVEDLDIDDLADLVEDLPATVIDEVLKSMDRDNRERLEQVLSYPEDTAGRLMNPDVVTVRADVNVDVVLRFLRLRGELPEHTDHLYVVSRRHQYLGRVSLASLVTHEDSTPINRLIDDEQPAIDVDESDDEVARQFSDHDWISAPVVDDNNILLGRITIDDVVDIIREQAEHQALGAAGLDEEEDLFSPVWRAMRRRLIWLSINLGTAFLAASVVGQFEGTIDKLVALAVLMPIVAGMGGNAGTQVLALMIRGLALGQVGAANVKTLLWKEARVGLLNGLVLGALLAVIVFFWFHSAGLSAVIFIALTANLLFAALAGVMVPVTLKRFGYDPALASSIFLTTVTDVMGFFTFLGLATLLLLH
ncbi:magnesium transporter [Pseudoxanthomonas dokdonensis]|uniref:Magnesium transporter MgtE n=1 Tax=Pseudoxanthomonas dokdonensis TaxID=344882 RepID=A0A0R0CDZ2_9GAMM|nr:magnesium transporter [Pseudoxanthomonas dokdonensis]KRG67965.1 magnesium transporter [Pseudoxanthomonas dokdonensis]